MKWVLLLCLVTCAYAASTYSLEGAEVLFENFIINYNRQYADEQEKQTRFEIFKQNLMKVNSLNDEQGGNEVFGITKFSDFSVNELKKLNGFMSFDEITCNSIKTDNDVPDAGAPDSWDWRDQNVVTDVKDQEFCGSCYSFSSTGNIEGQYAIKHKQLLSLSEQQIVDCVDREYNDNGCNGGNMCGTFRYLMDHGGIEKESDYEYVGIKTKCTFDKSKVAVEVTDSVLFQLMSQNKLKQLVYKNGPLSVAIDGTYLHHYEQGVLKDCAPRNLTHAILLVGYGTDPDDGDYWLLKNSWAANWGEHGYFRIERGEGKQSCGLLEYIVSAIVA